MIHSSKSRSYLTGTVSTWGYVQSELGLSIWIHIGERHVCVILNHQSIELKQGDLVTFRCFKESKRIPSQFKTSGHYKLQARKRQA